MIRIVIYDDNDQRRESLKALFMLTSGMTCVADFPDCSHVVDDMHRLSPDIVLMDIEMPGVNGISAVTMIKTECPEIRVIMQTVFEDEEKVFASLQAGAEGYILKSAPAERITQCIRDVHEGGAYMTPSVALNVMQYFSEKTRQNEAYGMTSKEQEVLKLLSEGLSYKMVADRLGISFFTVNAHVKKIYDKLHVHSLSEAMAVIHKTKV